MRERPMNLSTEAVTLVDLFANEQFVVPPFQRDYAWAIDQWEALWEDVRENVVTSQPHYMGALVLQRPDAGARLLRVIDGQQRLATVIVACSALLSHLKGRDAARFAALRRRYVGDEDPTSLRFRSRLTLNQTDDPFFQEVIVNLKQPAAAVSRLPRSQRQLWEGFQFFREKWKEWVPDLDPEKLTGAFESTFGTGLAFITINVTDELNAYAVFETLNARNLQLTSTDLLKNYIFSLLTAGATDLEQAQAQWGRISAIVEPESLPTFLRQFWSASHPLVRAERLFKALKSSVRSREEAFALLDALEKAAHWFRAAWDSTDELWTTPGQREAIRVLNLFGVSQHVPLLLACAAADFDDERLEGVLKRCVSLLFRYSIVAGRNPSALEQVFNRVAIAVTEKRLKTAQQVWQGPDGREGLRDLYLADDEFESAFHLFEFSSRKQKLARYVLLQIEARHAGAVVAPDVPEASIEHVLPENPGEGWTAYNEEQRRRLAHRLGNLVLLKRTTNRQLGNQSFAEKREGYLSSQWLTTQEVGRLTEWLPESIDERQDHLARIASQIWRVE